MEVHKPFPLLDLISAVVIFVHLFVITDKLLFYKHLLLHNVKFKRAEILRHDGCFHHWIYMFLLSEK